MAPAQYETVIRAVPLWLLQHYLEQIGAQPAADGTLAGPGWSARLAQAEDYTIGSLRVGQVRLEIEGDTEAIAAVRQALAPHLLRGGG
jgi:hypothetical protein